MNDYIIPEIITCGYFNCFEKFGSLKKSPERISKCIEIELFLEDGYSTFINGKELKIIKNCILLAKEGSVRYSLLPFKTAYLKISASGELQHLLNTLPDYFPAVHTEKIVEALDEIFVLYEEKDKNQLLIGSKILPLIDYLIKDANHYISDSPNAYPVMHKAKKIIENRFCEKITTADIASEVNLSESRFRFLFGKTYGISPHQYLTHVRISSAKQMMWDNTSMSEIAEKCGFGCQQYFNDIFKKETGMTPGKYKNELIRRYYND